jgi:L-threonylcarbamoyladenylate synthase
MSSKILKKNWNLVPEIEQRLEAGEVLILPTDTIYALVANGYHREAVTRLRQIKAFGSAQPLVVFTRKERAEEVVVVDEMALQMMNHFPYPVTMIMTAKPTLSEEVTGGFKNVFVSCPDRFIYDLVMKIPFPLVGTSAGFGDVKITNADSAFRFFGNKVPFIVDGGKSKHGRSGTLVDFTVEVPTIMNFGTVSVDDLRPLVPEIVLPSHLMK